MEKLWLVAALLLTTVPADAQGRMLPLKGQSVVDGDTLKVGRNRLRMLGYDAPEIRRPHYKCDAELAKGREAKAHLEFILSQGRVTVRRTQARDGYGRPLTQAWINGEPLADIMIKDGYGKPWDGVSAKPNWCE